MRECEASLVVVNTPAELGQAATWLERFTSGAGLPPDVGSKLEIVLDEILSNIFTHALAGAKEGERQVKLDLRVRAGRVELAFTDDGPEFNPVQAQADCAGRIAERRLGGVGLVFVRTLMDDMQFQRRNGHNLLMLTKFLPDAAP